ncbi:MAG: MarR family transcriptional regulator [Planctomycetes bacterium]|nr:MarR family transcriptional regulator [Planctomycetota bacterium]
MTDALPADVGLLDLLRKSGPLSVAELAQAMEVTATAVRQRLVRLMDQGCVRRSAIRAKRGRPSHRYELTPLGQRQTGANFADLAIALWQEIRAIKDPEVRRGLLERVSKRLAATYAAQIQGVTLEERMQSLASLFATRKIPLEVERRDQLPVLHVLACPYPELAEQDAGICAMERLLFAELLGDRIRLDECRLDGARCCTFHRGEN